MSDQLAHMVHLTSGLNSLDRVIALSQEIIERINIDHEAAISGVSTDDAAMKLAQDLRAMDPVSLSLECGFDLIGKMHRSGSIILPVREAAAKLEAARRSARSLGVSLSILAYTEARSAVAVTKDDDQRDLRFLTGSRTPEGLHAYCGGLYGAVGRALEYARYADVVGYKSSRVDLTEARYFASEVIASYPEKMLAFGYAPAVDSDGWNEAQHRAFETKLRGLGYQFYFVTQFGRTVFPYSAPSGAWVLLSDAAPDRGHSPAGEPKAHTIRIPASCATSRPSAGRTEK